VNRNALLLLFALVGIIVAITTTSPLSVSDVPIAPSNPLVLVAIVGLFGFFIYRSRRKR